MASLSTSPRLIAYSKEFTIGVLPIGGYLAQLIAEPVITDEVIGFAVNYSGVREIGYGTDRVGIGAWIRTSHDARNQPAPESVFAGIAPALTDPCRP